jgi:hypothetical protein
MLTRLVVSLAFVAFMAVPAAFAGGDCPFGHAYRTTHTADAESSTPQTPAPTTVVEAPAEAAPQTVVEAPVVAPVTIAEAPAATDETTQD